MKIKVSRHNLVIHPLSRFFCEEVELSNMITAYIMHIPNTLSLSLARNNRKQKSQ